MGFVSELAEGDALAAARVLAAEIAAQAPLAVRLTKALAMWGLDQPSLAEALEGQVRHPLFAEWMAADDTREGPKAFAEKRKVEWKGR